MASAVPASIELSVEARRRARVRTITEPAYVRYTLIDPGDGSPQAIADAERDVDFARNSGGAEDVAVIQDIQRAMRSRANETFTFGLFEGAISHFHRNLTRAVAR